MADPIPNHFTTEFSKNWIERIQQTKCRLDAYIEFDDFDGERKRYDRIGSMSSQQITDRKGQTRITDASTDNRWAYRAGYDIANTLDEDEAMNLGPLTLPDSDYVRQHTNAYHRDCDDVAWAEQGVRHNQPSKSCILMHFIVWRPPIRLLICQRIGCFLYVSQETC